MAVVPAFLLQYRMDIRAGQVVVFFALAMLTGTSKRLRLLWTVLVLLGSTVVFNLLTPFGRVLLELGPLAVTQGALGTGLSKGLSLTGLMLLSRLCVRRSVVLPGLPGLYVSATLSSLNRLLEAPRRVAEGGLLRHLDELLASVFRYTGAPPARRSESSRAAAVVAAALFVGANWGLVFFPA
ncbi:MAG: hypothetical protein JW820_07750 [Spirochaetales bacterium]|nr:hypothetical protein [Spirochaetales bacterium]